MITVLSRENLVRAAVVLIALTAIGWNIWNAGLVTGYIDPIRKLGAQDEAVYTREAIHMALYGNWPTQTFLDRFVLFKPPLLMWLSGVSVKTLGVNSLGVRLPAILSGVAICLFAFVMARGAGWAAVVLLISDRLFHTLARANLTDILLCACLVGCFAAFQRDTGMCEWRTVMWFGIGAGCAILTKSIAGLLPFVVVGLFWIFERGPGRPKVRRVLWSAAIALALALPWHVYQLLVHREWFIAEYFGVQLLAFGGKPPQTSQENQIAFYLSRLWYGDPELALLSLMALPALVMTLWRRNDSFALLLGCWLAVFGAALMIFQYRSVQYMLPLIPAMAILSARYLPALANRSTVAILAVAFVVKAASPAAPWGLPFASGNTIAVAGALSDYCEQRRDTDLIILDTDDEFYSAVLPLKQVRYGYVDMEDRNFRLEPHLHWLGVILNVPEFTRGDWGEYRERLRSWGLANAKPIGTSIFGKSIGEFQELVIARPQSDFLVPRTWLNAEMLRGRDLRIASDSRVFLLAHGVAQGASAAWGCNL